MSDRALRVFDGATAIVTGGASGIGRALGEELARRGSEVVLADLQIALAEEVASGIRDLGGRAEALRLDVIDFPAVESLVWDIAERTGRLPSSATSRILRFFFLFSSCLSVIL